MNKIFKNPYFNSVIAEVYIIFIVTLISFFGRSNTPDSLVDPIVALSLFVLSAAVMGFLFFGQPVLLFLNGEKKEAVNFFMKTVIGFAVITILAVLVLRFYPLQRSVKNNNLSLQDSITTLLSQKYDRLTSTLEVTVSTSTENFAKGTVNMFEGSGAVWFAAKTPSGWQLVFDGNGIVPCGAVDKYSFPKQMVPQCIDTQNGNRLITR